MRDILVGIFIVCVAVVLTFSFLWFIFWVVSQSYCNYVLKKGSNKLQWKCEETERSRELCKKTGSEQHKCILGYRVLPEELSWFVRVFGDNGWVYPFENEFTFVNKREFSFYVGIFKSYADIKSWVDKENGILWYEP